MIRTKAGQNMEEPNAEPIVRTAREPRHPSLNTSLLSAASQEDTMVDYLKNHPQGFSEMPFNSVDSLILSTLSYLDLDSYPYEDVLGGGRRSRRGHRSLLGVRIASQRRVDFRLERASLLC